VQAGVVTNEGTIAPGGRGFITQTLLSDQFVQTGTGTFAVDINGQGVVRPDRRLRYGPARRQGGCERSLSAGPGPMRYVILTRTGGVTDNGLGLSTSPACTPRFCIPIPTPLNSASPSISRQAVSTATSTSIANNLNSAFTRWRRWVSPVLLGLLNTDNLQDYKARAGSLAACRFTWTARSPPCRQTSPSRMPC
jgi:hypothetical protein